MQKKIIALAIAAAFSAPAFADTANVTVYGAVNMAVEKVSVGDAVAPATGAAYDATKVSSNVTKIGFKGSEDLGGGTSAIWQIESQVDADNSTGSFGSRNSFVGLSDKAMGTVLLGKHDTPYKMSTRGMDVFGDTIADNRSLMGGVSYSTTTMFSAGASFDGRQGNVIAYISPEMSGLTVIAAYVAGAEDTKSNTVNKGSAVSLSAGYKMDALNVVAAYETHTLGDNLSGSVAVPTGAPGALSGLKESAIKLGASYTMNALTLNAVYERTSDNFGPAVGATVDNALGHSSIYLAAKYNLDANNAVKVAYTKAGSLNSDDTATTGASQMSVGFDHAMSKRTSVYALYTNIANNDSAAYGLTTGGSTGGTGALAWGTYDGAKVSAIAAGLKHSF